MNLRTLMIAVALVGLVASCVGPSLLAPRRPNYIMPAVGSLRTVATSQSIFREGDKEADGVLDYGTLYELSATQLVDGVLGSGTKYGYVFHTGPSPTTPEFLWWATAAPDPALLERGHRLPWLAANQSGVIFCSWTGPIAIDPVTCVIDTRTATELGKRR